MSLGVRQFAEQCFFFMSDAKFRDTFYFIIQFECFQRSKPCNFCNGVLITLTKVFFFALCHFQAGFKQKFSNRLVLYYFKIDT